MSAIEWQDPPESQSRAGGGRKPKYITAEVEKALRSHPGRWALLDATGTAAYAAARRWCKRNPSFEFTSRGSRDAIAVYIRFMGEQS